MLISKRYFSHVNNDLVVFGGIREARDFNWRMRLLTPVGGVVYFGSTVALFDLCCHSFVKLTSNSPRYFFFLFIGDRECTYAITEELEDADDFPLSGLGEVGSMVVASVFIEGLEDVDDFEDFSLFGLGEVGSVVVDFDCTAGTLSSRNVEIKC